MRDVDIFQMALGLTPPWEVASCAFSPEKKRLDIRLTFPRGGVFVCPECGRTGLKAYDTLEKTWRHLNFFQHEAWLSAKVPRVKCEQAVRRQAGHCALGPPGQRFHPALRGAGHEHGRGDAGQDACRTHR